MGTTASDIETETTAKARSGRLNVVRCVANGTRRTVF